MTFLLDTDTVSYALRGRNGVDEALRFQRVDGLSLVDWVKP